MTPASSKTTGAIALQNLLTNDLLLSVFDKVSVVHRKRLARVCKRWKYLIDITFLWVDEFNAVDDRRCVTDWAPSGWLGLKFVAQRDYIRIPKVSASEILSRTARHLPNLTVINLECCDMNSRIMRPILNSCKKIERLNLDSSTRLNNYSLTLMAQDWTRLKHVNLSCCTEVNEVSALFLIQNLTRLESLNLCGTRIKGDCLDRLNARMKRLDISYCWAVQDKGLDALVSAPCRGLEELSVNNLDFDGAESRLIGLMNRFVNLKHLQLSIGPCVAPDYFIDRITTKGFSAISKLTQLETLIIERICILDNPALSAIIQSCSKLKFLKLNLLWSNYCTDLSFSHLDSYLSDLEELHILYPTTLQNESLSSIGKLEKLRSLSLVNCGIDNETFKHIEKLHNLTSIRFDECRKITLKGLNHLCRIVERRQPQEITASFLGTGIYTTKLKSRTNLPVNLRAQISHFRSLKNVIQLPISVINS